MKHGGERRILTPWGERLGKGAFAVKRFRSPGRDYPLWVVVWERVKVPNGVGYVAVHLHTPRTFVASRGIPRRAERLAASLRDAAAPDWTLRDAATFAASKLGAARGN